MTDRLLLVAARITATSRALFRVPGAIGLPAAWTGLLFDPAERFATLCENALAFSSAVAEEPSPGTHPLEAAPDIPVRGPDTRPARTGTPNVPSSAVLSPEVAARASFGSRDWLQTRNVSARPAARFVTPVAENLSSSNVAPPPWERERESRIAPAPPPPGATAVRWDAPPPPAKESRCPARNISRTTPQASRISPPRLSPGNRWPTPVQHSMDLSRVLSANLADRQAEHVKGRLPAPAVPNHRDQTKHAGLRGSGSRRVRIRRS